MPGGAPEDFTAIGLTSTSVQLKWDPPARKLRHGEIVLYEVIYHRADNAVEDFAVNATDTSVIVDGLDVDADYIFQLRAYTVKGSGPWTSRLPFKTFANRQYYLPFLLLICSQTVSRQLFSQSVIVVNGLQGNISGCLKRISTDLIP